jgi:P-type Cu+ transporter
MQASSDMAALYQLLPVTARLVVGDSEDTKEVPAEAVGVGDVIKLLPGDCIPVDGVVVSGRTSVDESTITGELMPVTKTAGLQVTAGTINVDGAPRLAHHILHVPMQAAPVWLYLACLSHNRPGQRPSGASAHSRSTQTAE